MSLFAMALACALPQQVLVVDDDGGPEVDYTSLQSAIDGAQEGGLIEVRDGIYGGAVVSGKSLVITTVASGSAVLNDGMLIRDLGPSQTVTVRGFGMVELGSADAPLIIEQNQGVVWIENTLVVVDHQNHEQGIRIDSSSDVVMRVCTVAPQSGLSSETPGIRATNSALHLYEVNSTGSANALAAGSAGIELFDSFLYASDCTFMGGNGGIACPNSCFQQPGGPGILLDGMTGSTAALNNTVLTGGRGGLLNGIWGQDGPPSQILSGTLSEQAETPRGIDIQSPVRTHETAQLTVVGAPGEFVYAVYSKNPAPLFLPSFFGSYFMGTPAAMFFLTTLDSQGTGSIQLSPSLPAGVNARTLYTQMLHVELTGSGAQFDLGPPASVVIINATP